MTGEVVNLRQVRKRKSRAEKDAQAQRNRAEFGRTKTDKTIAEAEQARRERDLDGKRRTLPELDQE